MSAFNRRQNTGVWFLASLGSQTSPSAAAVAAGTPIHEELRAWTGFTSSVEQLDNSDMGSTWAGTIPGGETPADSSLTIRAGNVDSDQGEVIRGVLAENTEGFIVIVKRSKTPASGQRCDVFPIRVNASNDNYSTDNAIADYTVGISIYDPPSKNRAMVA